MTTNSLGRGLAEQVLVTCGAYAVSISEEDVQQVVQLVRHVSLTTSIGRVWYQVRWQELWAGEVTFHSSQLVKHLGESGGFFSRGESCAVFISILRDYVCLSVSLLYARTRFQTELTDG